MKSLVWRVVYLLQIHRFFRYFNRKKLAILLYHGVSPKISQGISNYRGKFIEPKNFNRQIKYLKKNYTILELDKAIELLKSNSLPLYSLIITFDDGYKNFYDYAYPILKQNQIPATVFLPTDFIDKKIPLWVDRLEYAIGLRKESFQHKIKTDTALRQKLKLLPENKKNEELKKIEDMNVEKLDNFSGEKSAYAPLEWSQILEMQNNKINFGAHTKTHPILTQLSAEETKKEITESALILKEKTGKISKIFSYPNGQPKDFNEEIKTIMKKTNFKGALTTIEGFNDKNTDMFELKRITMDKTDNFAYFLSCVSGIKFFIKKLFK